MKKTVCMILLFITICLLNGCSAQQQMPPKPHHRVITGITVTYNYGPFFAHKRYETDANMQPILNYLRRIDPYGRPDADPETVSGSDFRFELIYSDGSAESFRQKSERFMQGADGIWKRINPKKAIQIYEILHELEDKA